MQLPGFWYKLTFMKRFFITANADTPLIRLVAEHLPDGYDPSVVLTSGGVWKDRKRVLDPELPIGAGETVKVHLSAFQGRAYTLDSKQVVFENDDFLVVYKPHEINVHAIPTSIHYQLAHAVDCYLAQQGIIFESTPIMRLDRSVAGLVLFAKNKNAERLLFRLSTQRLIQKWYTAIVEKRDVGGPRFLRIQDVILNIGTHTILHADGKAAHTLFIRTSSLENAEIYSAFIFTGRRHQIRFHAAHYIAPILGDSLYGSVAALPPDKIALICRGINIPYKKTMLRIRLPQEYMDMFHDRFLKKSVFADKKCE